MVANIAVLLVLEARPLFLITLPALISFDNLQDQFATAQRLVDLWSFLRFRYLPGGTCVTCLESYLLAKVYCYVTPL